MTGDAIFHRQSFQRTRRRPIEGFHGSMARLARELGHTDVHSMGEKYMRRQAPHPLPGNILSLVAKGLELGNLGAFRVTAGMTGETQRRRRTPGDKIFFGALMATGAGNFLSDVSFVGKLDGLFDR